MAQLYLNVLDLEGEAAGMAYWTAELDAGASRGLVLHNIANSDENIAATAEALQSCVWYGL